MRKIIRVFMISLIAAGLLCGVAYFILNEQLNSLWFVTLVDESINRALFYIQAARFLYTTAFWLCGIGMVLLIGDIGITVFRKKMTKDKS